VALILLKLDSDGFLSSLKWLEKGKPRESVGRKATGLNLVCK
jgi:hypothetical protein